MPARMSSTSLAVDGPLRDEAATAALLVINRSPSCGSDARSFARAGEAVSVRAEVFQKADQVGGAEVVVSGFGPVLRAAFNCCSRPNQKGAPSEIARPVSRNPNIL